MAIKNIKRYLKIYYLFLRYRFMLMATYRVSFIIEFLIEIGYIVWTMIFFDVILFNIDSIAGWSRGEVMFLVGLAIVFGELMTGLFYVWNTRLIAEKVRLGDVDFALLKPINSQFLLTASQIYPSSFLAILLGLWMMFRAIVILNPTITLINLIAGIIIFICANIIGYSLLTVLSSLTIKFINADFLTRISFDLFYFGSRPHQIYSGILKIIFFLVLPMVFIASVPSEVILRGGTLLYVPLAIAVASVFFILARKIWNLMINNYASASS